MFGILDLIFFGAAAIEIYEENKPSRPIMGFNWDLYWKDIADGMTTVEQNKQRKKGRYNLYK